MSIARLKQLQVVFIVAVETVVIPVVLPMSHHNAGMFLWNNQIEIRVKTQSRRLTLFVAPIAIEVRKVLLHLD